MTGHMIDSGQYPNIMATIPAQISGSAKPKNHHRVARNADASSSPTTYELSRTP